MKIYLYGYSGYLGKILRGKILLNINSKQNLICVGRSRESDIFLDLSSLNLSDLKNISFHKDSIFVMLAANSSPTVQSNQILDYIKINYLNTKLLFENLIKQKIKIIFISSDCVYGNTQKVCDELSETNPIGLYGTLKLLIEDFLKHYDLFKVTRLSYVYSSHDSFINYIKDCVIKSREASVYKFLNRNIVCLDDVVEGLCSLVFNFDSINHKLINFSGPENLSREGMVKILRKYINFNYRIIDPPTNFFNDRPKKIITESRFFNQLLSGKAQYYNDYIHANQHLLIK